MSTETKIDGNSSTNQKIKSQFVGREVLTCFSYEMDSILKRSCEGSNEDFPSWDSIENAYADSCPHCGEEVDWEGDEIDEKEVCPYCNEEIILRDDLESNPQEIYEWWIVTEFLYRKMKERGHPVLEWGNNCYWGRCTTGQAILLDGSITSICKEIEILEGQKYDWSRSQNL